MKQIIIPVLILFLLDWNGSSVNESNTDTESVPTPEKEVVIDSLKKYPPAKLNIELGVSVHTDNLTFPMIPGSMVLKDVNELKHHFEIFFDVLTSFDVYKVQPDYLPYCPEWALSTWEGQDGILIDNPIVLSSWTTSVEFRKTDGAWQISRIHVSQN